MECCGGHMEPEKKAHEGDGTHSGHTGGQSQRAGVSPIWLGVLLLGGVLLVYRLVYRLL